MNAIAKDDWTGVAADPMLCSWAVAARDFLKEIRMSTPEAAPDRRFWTAYDHFMFEREARAMRREYLYAMLGRVAKRVAARMRVELAKAGAQPPKNARAH